MTEQPLISVITPAFNNAETLKRAYDSLSRQTLHSWEHVIVNDGSTDSTAAVAMELVESDVRVNLISISNRGQGAALNLGLGQARGQFIAFLDADDEYLPDHLQKHWAVMQECPSVDILWGGVDVIVKDPLDAYVPDIVKGFGYIHTAECVVQGTLFVRRHVFDTHRFSEDRLVWYQDFEFFDKARQSFKTARFPDVTYRYYRNSGSSLVDRVKSGWPVSDVNTAMAASATGS